MLTPNWSLPAVLQFIASIRTPEINEAMPEVEAIPYGERVDMVRRAHGNIEILIKNWDKFSVVLSAHGHDKTEIMRISKNLKKMKENLAHALIMADPKKVSGPLKEQAEGALNVLIAWFWLNRDYMGSALSHPNLTKEAIASLKFPNLGAAAEVDGPEMQDLVDADVHIDGSNNVRVIREEDIIDLVDASGKSFEH